MNRFALTSFAAVAVASCGGFVAAPPDPRAARADAAVEALVADGYAGSVLIACGADVLFARDDGVETPGDGDPSYWLASIAKQFTAALIVKLEDEGVLSFDDPVSRYFPYAPPDKAGITIDQLLTHHAGLGSDYAADGIVDRDAAARAIFADDLESQPGTRFGYTNDAYSLLAMIAEIASGMSFEVAMREKIFDPAGLRGVAMWPDEETGRVASPHAGMTSSGLAVENWATKGPSGMRMPMRDLHRWVVALRDGRAMSAAARDELLAPRRQVRDGLNVGYGWFHESQDAGPTVTWARGYEWSVVGDTAYGANAVLYTYDGTGWIIAAATHAGPPETGDGPVTGWSRRVRDAMYDVYVAPEGGDCPA